MRCLYVLFFLLIAATAHSKEAFYCINTKTYDPYVGHADSNTIIKNRCLTTSQTSSVEIPEQLFKDMISVKDFYSNKANTAKVNTVFQLKLYKDDPEFIKEWDESLKKIYLSSTEEIKEYDKKRLVKINQIQSYLVDLQKTYGKKCSNFDTGTKEFNNCLIDQEKIVKDVEQKKIIAKKEQELKKQEAETYSKKSQAEKLADAEAKKQKALEDKKLVEVLKTKEAAEKLAKMTPDDRRAYICNEKYGFRKGSDNFKECVFKIYSAEIELEKIELQKQLAKANADLAKANAASNEKLANAQTNAAIMQAYAAQQQAIAANTADSLALMESGLRMMSPQRPAVAPMRTCTYNRNFMNCF